MSAVLPSLQAQASGNSTNDAIPLDAKVGRGAIIVIQRMCCVPCLGVDVGVKLKPKAHGRLVARPHHAMQRAVAPPAAHKHERQ